MTSENGGGRRSVLSAELEGVLAGYAGELAGAALAPDTRRTYVSRVRVFLAWLPAGVVPSGPAVRDRAVRAYLDHLEGLGRSGRYVNNALAALDDFFERSGPGRTSLGRASVAAAGLAVAPDEQSVARWRAAVESWPHARDRLLALLPLATGARVGELVALDVQDLRRTCDPQLRAALDAWLADRSTWTGAAGDALFLNQRGGRLSSRAAASVFTAISRSAGLDLTPDTLRLHYRPTDPRTAPEGDETTPGTPRATAAGRRTAPAEPHVAADERDADASGTRNAAEGRGAGSGGSRAAVAGRDAAPGGTGDGASERRAGSGRSRVGAGERGAAAAGSRAAAGGARSGAEGRPGSAGRGEAAGEEGVDGRVVRGRRAAARGGEAAAEAAGRALRADVPWFDGGEGERVGIRRGGLRGGQRERRERIVDAAMRMMFETDYERIQVKDVADQAGVALGTLYRYFASKDHVFACALMKWGSGFSGQVAWAEGARLDQRVASVYRRAAQAFENDPRVYMMLTQLQSTRDAHAAEVYADFVRMQNRAFATTLEGLPAEVHRDIVWVMGAVLSEALRSRMLGLFEMDGVYERIDRAASLILK